MSQANTILTSYLVKTREVEYLKRQYIEKLDQLEKLEKSYLQAINGNERAFSKIRNEYQNNTRSSTMIETETIKCSYCNHELFHLNKDTMSSSDKDDYLILFPKLKPTIDHSINIEEKPLETREPLKINLNDRNIKRIINKKSKHAVSQNNDSKDLQNSYENQADKTSLNKGYTKFKKTCSYCGEGGHKRAQCHNRLNLEKNI